MNFKNLLETKFKDSKYILDQKLTFERYFSEIYGAFSCVANRDVLEIGPFSGFHTMLAETFIPKSMTLVEPNESAVNQLVDLFPGTNVLCEDIFKYLEQDRKFDVVVCCGVLYHLHNPFYLLELIVNRSNPEFIIIETIASTVNESQNFWECSLGTEVVDMPGNKYSQPGWKSVGLHLLINQSAIDMAMEQLGYKCTYFNDYKTRFLNISKEYGVMTVWQKQ